MRLGIKSIILVFLMLAFSLSVATNSIPLSQSLNDEDVARHVLVPHNSANVSGSLEGSIYSESTISSGESHTCVIIENGSVNY